MWFRASKWTGLQRARGWMVGNIVSYAFSIQLIFGPDAWSIKEPLEQVVEQDGGVGTVRSTMAVYGGKGCVL